MFSVVQEISIMKRFRINQDSNPYAHRIAGLLQVYRRASKQLKQINIIYRNSIMIGTYTPQTNDFRELNLSLPVQFIFKAHWIACNLNWRNERTETVVMVLSFRCLLVSFIEYRYIYTQFVAILLTTPSWWKKHFWEITPLLSDGRSARLYSVCGKNSRLPRVQPRLWTVWMIQYAS